MASFAKLLALAVPVLIAASIRTREDRKRNGGRHPLEPQPAPGPTSPAVHRAQGASVTAGGIIDGLSEEWSQAREDAIVEAIFAGNFDTPKWGTVVSKGSGELAGYSLSIPVMADALTVEGVRVVGTLRSGQRIADRLNLMMMTPYVAGLISEQADAKIPPNAPQPASALKSRMLQESATTDRALQKVGAFAIVDNAGKFWVISIRNTETAPHPTSGQPKATAAVNHGLFTSPWLPIQNVGTFHSIDNHTDSTQNHRYIGRHSELKAPNGSTSVVDNKLLVMDEKFGPLLNGVKGKLYGKQVGEGVLPYNRHPAIAPEGMVIA